MTSVLKLGTRRSLLAWAQSSWVAREVERLNPGVRVELVGIETQGDRILDISLRKVEGKEFFVAELDQALAASRVDFTVHSMKDLSLDRPAEFVRAAIPRRENPRDVVFFSEKVVEKIRAGRPIKIGTSSPRRLENLPEFLKKALPQVAPTGAPTLEFVEIRGNVNTRLSRVHEEDSSPKQLDGVVLAFAGIIRLWADQTGRAELEKLFQGVRWMVLPLRENPTAPAQGALAIECRTADARVREILSKLHDEETAVRVAKERELLALWGGGCHQRFGATAIESASLGKILYIRGAKAVGESHESVEEVRWQAPQPPAKAIAWDGSHERETGSITELPASLLDLGTATFIAHARAVRKEWMSALQKRRIWTSGTPSWYALAERGLWVEGCAEGMGFGDLLPTLKQSVLRLPTLDSWEILTHDRAVSGWDSGRVISAYHIEAGYSAESRASLARATHVFWSSGSQWDELKNLVSPQAVQSCGPGKTWEKLKAAGLKPVVFPSVEEWREWIKKSVNSV